MPDWAFSSTGAYLDAKALLQKYPEVDAAIEEIPSWTEARRGNQRRAPVFQSRIEFVAALVALFHEYEQRGVPPSRARAADDLCRQRGIRLKDPARQFHRWAKGFGFRDWPDVNRTVAAAAEGEDYCPMLPTFGAR